MKFNLIMTFEDFIWIIFFIIVVIIFLISVIVESVKTKIEEKKRGKKWKQ